MHPANHRMTAAELDVVPGTTPPALVAPRADGLLGHPTGLYFLAGTEFWERISYHGMQALLTLYMVEQLLLPGHVERIAGFAHFRAIIEALTGPLSAQALASQIFGLYVGLIYLSPVLGGFLGDRVLGRRSSVTLGALLMTAGHFCMAFDASFLVALLLLIVGAGALRGNLISQIGDLYTKSDQRREEAFQIYFGMVNTAAFVAPLIIGALSQAYGWHYGFGFAGFGMLAGLILYLSGVRHTSRDATQSIVAAREPLSGRQRRVVVVMLLMLPLFALFWIAQSQVWNVYNLWARNSVDLLIAGWNMPVAWLQSFDGLAAVAVVPPVLWLWRRQAARSRELDDFAKLGTGCLLFGVALAWLASSQLAVTHPAGKVPLLWALAFHILSNIGWVYFVPTVMSLLSRAAPARVNALMIGLYYASIFVGCTISGWLGGLYERLPIAQFWLLHAALVAGGGVSILLLAPGLRRTLTTEVGQPLR
jgi:POT family proton-dependent oligopeptide transporter